MLAFRTKLALFLAPFAVAYSVPVVVLWTSGEFRSADSIASLHVHAPSTTVYGPAYTNPDARYKLSSILLRRPRLVALGSSRALEWRADHFRYGEGEFYNAGSLAERLYEFRRALKHLPADTATETIIVLDQWSFNQNWKNAVDNPEFEAELSDDGSDILNILQQGTRSTWRDALLGRLDMGALLSGDPHYGVNGRVRGNGFRKDGSYCYAEVLTRPERAKDFEFKESLVRVASGTKGAEFGSKVDPAALREVRALFHALRERRGATVVYLAPFAPTVTSAFRMSSNHTYLESIGPAVQALAADAGIPFFDFTSCVELGCVDAEFIDGFHPGATANARLLLEMASKVAWLDTRVDRDEVAARLQRTGHQPELAFPAP